MRHKVNRYLKDKAMDHIDHALGRPVDPMGETYREYFAASEPMFRDDPRWRLYAVSGGMFWYTPTQAGREALRDHLRQIGDKHRCFTIKVKGFPASVYVAESHGKARYKAYLNFSDAYEGTTFKDFCSTSSVRLKQGGE